MPIKNIDLNYLSEFVTVCDAGSFTAAAEKLGMAKSMLSEHITRLESQMGSQLLMRTTRKLKLTEIGLDTLNLARQTIEHMQLQLSALQDASQQLSGKIRISSALDYSVGYLSVLFAQFSRQHPLIELEVIASDEHVDLIDDSIDLIIRVGWLTDSSHRATRIGRFKQKLVTAPSYLKRIISPQTPSDLDQLNWLVLNVMAQHTWQFQSDQRTIAVKSHGRLSSNTSLMIHQWALQGHGITVLPDYQVQADLDSGKLTELLPDWHLPEGGIHAVYSAHKHLPARTRALIDFLKNHTHSL